MHVHLPKEGSKSVRSFFMELFTITCGVLIALSLEGLHQMIHQRHLVREARANIRAELLENRRLILNVKESIPGELANLKGLIALCRRERMRRGSVDFNKEPKPNLSINGALLSSISWNTAQSLGAVGLMKYEDVKRYKGLYGLQDLVQSVQQQAMDRWVQAGSISATIGEELNMKVLSNQELANVEHLAGQAYSYTNNLGSMIHGLVQSYDEFQAETH